MKICSQHSLLIILISLFVGCSKKETENETEDVFRGTQEDIETFYTSELLNSLQNLGFLLNTGVNPPNIEGTYTISPFILKASTLATDTVGNIFADQTLIFSNHNNEALTIDFQIEGGDQLTVGTGSFISGANNNFSVFLVSKPRMGESVLVDTAVSLSGQTDSLAIKNFQWAGLVLDNKGDPDDLYITNADQCMIRTTYNQYKPPY
ncbi:hypothetical protein ACFQZJ_06150 [Maribacter chungangensis]|uniref:DUF4843 domain-containing protein n=1 Tax=Maribacter chungangensis TaxID=1069117 RepID=A0ABW3B1E4_9FLAO